MPKEELLEFEGLVTEILPDARYRVELDNGHALIAYTAGRMKKNRIKTPAGDRVTVEVSPYDLEKGRQIFRHKDERTAPSKSPTATQSIPPEVTAMLAEPANNNDVTVEREAPMRIFVFKSEARPGLHAFGAELDGSRLPKQFRPWRATGAIGPDRDPPHELSRAVIEQAIKTRGFQLWRMSKKD